MNNIQLNHRPLIKQGTMYLLSGEPYILTCEQNQYSLVCLVDGEVWFGSHSRIQMEDTLEKNNAELITSPITLTPTSNKE